MKNKIKVVSMTLKFTLLGVMAFAYVACGESKEANKALWDYSKLSKDEFIQLLDECHKKLNKNACQKFIDNGLPSVSQCDNEARSCFFVGLAYEGIEQYKQAFEYYEKGCLKDDGYFQNPSCFNLAWLYYQGKGVRQDKVVAKKYFGKACDLGEEKGCNNYRILNEQGVK